jgi:putative transposase
MARLPRPDLAGIPQHVVQRGNDRLPCFYDDGDRLRYLTALRQVALRYGCRVHAYVLMTNHVHLLLTPDAVGAVGRMMQGLGRLYVAGFNGRHRRTGTLWEGRYKPCLVDSERYVLACYRYIELNPVRAAMVADPSEYRWSSHAANARGEDCALLTPHAAFVALGPTLQARIDAYRELFRDALSDDDVGQIRAYIQQQRALGSDRFQAMVERKLGRCAAVRAAHRPRRSEKAL